MIAPFRSRDPRIVLVLLLAVGLVLLIVNADLPFVRHSMVYIKAVSKVMRGDVSLGQLVSDPNAYAYEKPLGVVLSLLPLVAAFGYLVGPLVHSYVTAALFALASFAVLRRLCRRLDVPGDRLGAMLVVTFFNPVAVYQFWAVGPDALFSAAFLASFALLDRLIGRSGSRPGGEGPASASIRTWLWFGLYLLTLYATVIVKFYGVVALPLHLIYAFAFTRRPFPSPRALAPFVLPLALLLLCIAIYPGRQVVGTKDFAAYLDMANIFDGGRASGPPEESSRLAGFVGNAAMIAVALLLSLNVLVACVARRYRRPELPILLIVALFAGGLLFHDASYYNLRFLLPVSPFLAALAVGAPRFASRRLVGTFLAVAAALVLFFNVPNPGALAIAPRKHHRDELSVARVLKIFDNLRLGARMRMRMAMDLLPREIPPGEHLVIVVGYYGDAYHGTFELTGFFEPRFEIHYFRSCGEVVPPSSSFYLATSEKSCELPFPCSRESVPNRLERVTVLTGGRGEHR